MSRYVLVECVHICIIRYIEKRFTEIKDIKKNVKLEGKRYKMKDKNNV